MRRVFKYRIPWGDYSSQPANAHVERILSVGVQDDYLYAWAIIEDDPNYVWHDLSFRVAGTGHDLDSGDYTPTDEYIGTAHHEGLVFHVFGNAALFTSSVMR
jgi:hypothetical protein